MPEICMYGLHASGIHTKRNLHVDISPSFCYYFGTETIIYESVPEDLSYRTACVQKLRVVLKATPQMLKIS